MHEEDSAGFELRHPTAKKITQVDGRTIAYLYLSLVEKHGGESFED
jgi:hypothetical protein